MKKVVLATGSNIGDSVSLLKNAIKFLSEELHFLESSNIYKSKAVDYLNQPDFYNQVLCFETDKSPQDLLYFTSTIENRLGRSRLIDKGPRTIDIDILFYELEVIDQHNLIIPHPRLFQRSFVVLPLKELEIFKILEKHFSFPSHFDNNAYPIS